MQRMFLKNVGLEYLTLNRTAGTLSGGESQRVKLAYHLSRENVEPTLFIFDEPTKKSVYAIQTDAAKKKNGTEEIGATLAANILGIGNAATPLALRAMKKLDENRTDVQIRNSVASDDMITFAVMNTVPFALLPTGVLAMRSAFGSAEAFSVIPCIWICSASSCVAAVVLCRIVNRLRRRKE